MFKSQSNSQFFQRTPQHGLGFRASVYHTCGKNVIWGLPRSYSFLKKQTWCFENSRVWTTKWGLPLRVRSEFQALEHLRYFGMIHVTRSTLSLKDIMVISEFDSDTEHVVISIVTLCRHELSRVAKSYLHFRSSPGEQTFKNNVDGVKTLEKSIIQLQNCMHLYLQAPWICAKRPQSLVEHGVQNKTVFALAFPGTAREFWIITIRGWDPFSSFNQQYLT